MSVAFSFEDSGITECCDVPVEGVFRDADSCGKFFSGESGCFLEVFDDVGFGFVFEEDLQDCGVFCVFEAVEIVSAAAGFFMNFYHSSCGHCPKLVGDRPAGCGYCFDDFVELCSRVFLQVGGYQVRQC